MSANYRPSSASAVSRCWRSRAIRSPLGQGQGVLVSDDIRYRVIDVWFSFDGVNGRRQEGLHVFLERTEEAPPWPARLGSRSVVGPVSAG